MFAYKLEYDFDARTRRMDAMCKHTPRAIERFNKHHPVGSEVLLDCDCGKSRRVTVTHKARKSSAGHPVAWFSDVTGSYHIGCVRPIAEEGSGAGT